MMDGIEYLLTCNTRHRRLVLRVLMEVHKSLTRNKPILAPVETDNEPEETHDEPKETEDEPEETEDELEETHD